MSLLTFGQVLSTVRYRSIGKLLDAKVGIRCSAKTIVQNNVTLRINHAVQWAFGRTGCAEQSTMAWTVRKRWIRFAAARVEYWTNSKLEGCLFSNDTPIEAHRSALRGLADARWRDRGPHTPPISRVVAGTLKV